MAKRERVSPGEETPSVEIPQPDALWGAIADLMNGLNSQLPEASIGSDTWSHAATERQLSHAEYVLRAALELLWHLEIYGGPAGLAYAMSEDDRPHFLKALSEVFSPQVVSAVGRSIESGQSVKAGLLQYNESSNCYEGADALKTSVLQYAESHRAQIRTWEDQENESACSTSARCEAAQEAASEANAFEPSAGSYGIFSFDDGPGYAGGGMGTFIWFPNRSAMLAFVRDHLAFFGAGGHEAVEALDAKVGRVVTKLQAGETDDRKAIRAINRILKGFEKIEWWGSFSELCKADKTFPRKIRRWYQEDNEDAGVKKPHDPIPKDQIDGFRDAIKEYGF
jgi:hypothetical protein